MFVVISKQIQRDARWTVGQMEGILRDWNIYIYHLVYSYIVWRERSRISIVRMHSLCVLGSVLGTRRYSIAIWPLMCLLVRFMSVCLLCDEFFFVSLRLNRSDVRGAASPGLGIGIVMALIMALVKSFQTTLRGVFGAWRHEIEVRICSHPGTELDLDLSYVINGWELNKLQYYN